MARASLAGHLDMARSGHQTCGSAEQEIRFARSTAAASRTRAWAKGRWWSSAAVFVSHLEEEWADPRQRAFYEELARTHRVVRYDRLGT